MFNTLYRTVTMLVRMLKSACLRPFRTLYTRFRRATNLTHQASTVVPKLAKSITNIKAKPTKREDYVDAGSVYIAKSLVFIVIAVIIAIWLLGQFVVWPWMESKWFTAKIYQQEQKVEDYTGRVKLFYDEEKTQISFYGKLEDGVKTGKGVEYYTNGIEAFSGSYDENGLYTGECVTKDEKGNLIYEGGFAAGLYEGTGKLYQNNQLFYEGDFVQGERTGDGKEYMDGVLAYEGAFIDGVYEGMGKTYHANGQVAAECLTFVAGKPNGTAVYYNEDGSKAYEGAVNMGVKDGQGTQYDSKGIKLYTGGFAADAYEGEGTAFHANGAKKYVGTFVGGAYEGTGTLYKEDGSLQYEGAFVAGQYGGEGTLQLDNGMAVRGVFAAGQLQGAGEYTLNGAAVYTGVMENGDAQGQGVLYADGQPVYTGNFNDGFIDGGALMNLPVSDLRETIFAGAELAESQAERGFIIVNEGLQAAVFCNYGYDDAEIVVHRVYLYGEGLDSWFNGDAFVIPEGYTREETGTEIPLSIPGVEVTAQTARTRQRYVYEDYVIRLWQNAQGEVDLIEWRSWTDLTTETATEDSEGAVVENLLEALGFGAPAPTAESETMGVNEGVAG